MVIIIIMDKRQKGISVSSFGGEKNKEWTSESLSGRHALNGSMKVGCCD